MELNFNQNNKTYLIDTSALIILDMYFNPNNPVFKAIWEEMEELIKIGAFRTIDYVEGEINKYEGDEVFLKKWVKKWKKHFVAVTDIQSYNASRPIIDSEYKSGFFDAKKLAAGIDEADPYLIGYCLTHNCILITNESKVKPNKIPAVASKFGVICIDIYDFFNERGLRMQRNMH